MSVQHLLRYFTLKDKAHIYTATHRTKPRVNIHVFVYFSIIHAALFLDIKTAIVSLPASVVLKRLKFDLTCFYWGKNEKYSILLRFIQTQNYFQIWFDPAAAACMDFAFSFYSASKAHPDLRIKNCRERTEVYDKTPVPLYPWRAVIYSTRQQRDLQSVSLDLISPPVGEERKIQFPESSLSSSIKRPPRRQGTEQINVCLYMRTSLMSRGCLNPAQLYFKAQFGPGGDLKVLLTIVFLKCRFFWKLLLSELK